MCRVIIQSILTPGGNGRKRKSYEILLPRLPLCGIIEKEGSENGETDKAACGGACLLLLVASGVLLLASLLLLLWRE